MSFGEVFAGKDAPDAAARTPRPPLADSALQWRRVRRRQPDLYSGRFDEKWIGVTAHIVQLRLSRRPASQRLVEALAIRRRFLTALDPADARRIDSVAAIDAAIFRGLVASL